MSPHDRQALQESRTACRTKSAKVIATAELIMQSENPNFQRLQQQLRLATEKSKEIFELDMRVFMTIDYHDQESMDREVGATLDFKDDILDRIAKIQNFVDNRSYRNWQHKSKDTRMQIQFPLPSLQVFNTKVMNNCETAGNDKVEATCDGETLNKSAKQQDFVGAPNPKPAFRIPKQETRSMKLESCEESYISPGDERTQTIKRTNNRLCIRGKNKKRGSIPKTKTIKKSKSTKNHIMSVLTSVMKTFLNYIEQQAPKLNIEQLQENIVNNNVLWWAGLSKSLLGHLKSCLYNNNLVMLVDLVVYNPGFMFHLPAPGRVS